MKVYTSESIVVKRGGKDARFDLTIASEHYSRCGDDYPVKCYFISDYDVDITLVFNRNVDRILFSKEGYVFDNPANVVAAVKSKVYDWITDYLDKAYPDEWNRYMFGPVKLWTPLGVKYLNDYIMHLNDVDKMPREDIAAHIEDLMGEAVPKIPINPLSWILEDRPLEFGTMDD